MEQKDINIYEILKGVEYGTELYTPMCGNVVFTCLPSNNETIRTEKDLGIYRFDKNGRWMEGGEVMLFPSNEMRDWSKFFKKGDVLICYEGKKPYYTIFDGFESNTYRAFKGKFAYDCCEDKWYQNEGNLSTNTFHKLNREDSEIYVTKIEERFGGKLNRETLEIEKTQPEFKDGDIVFMKGIKDGYFANCIFILRSEYKDGDERAFYYAFYNADDKFTTAEYGYTRVHYSLRPATDSEKQQLFDALAKEGKRLDSEHKMIVDLKPAFEIGKLYVFREEDEDGELTIIGELIDKNESEDTLTFGNQYEIENEKFVTDQTFDLRISVNKELREATENEVELFNKHYDIWKNGKEQPAFKTFDKVLVRCGEKFKWLPAFFVRDRGEDFASRYNVLPLHSGKAADFTQCIPYEGHENFAFTDYDFVDLPF